MGSCQSRKQQAKEVVVPRPEGSSHDSGGEKTSSEYVVRPILDYRLREGNLTRNMVHIESPTGIQIEEVYDGVHDGLILGSGNSVLVREITHKATGIQYAVKCLDLGLVNSPEELGQLRDEITIMCQLDHPNIIRLKEVYETYTNIYMVQELCMGRDLIYRLDDQPDYHYTEGECARLLKQILVAVRYLHSKGVIHRDLKLENFFFLSTSSDSKLKMIGK
jgi:calcium-dependent protein kinase